MAEDITLRQQNAKEYTFVLRLLYNRYINITRDTIEKDIAVYGNTINSIILFLINVRRFKQSYLA